MDKLKKLFKNKYFLLAIALVIVILVIFQLTKKRTVSVAEYMGYVSETVIDTNKDVLQKWSAVPNDLAVVNMALYKDKSFDLAIYYIRKKKRMDFTGQWSMVNPDMLKLDIVGEDTINGQKSLMLPINKNFQPMMIEFFNLLLEQV